MNKKVITIKFLGNPIYTADVREMDIGSYLALKKESEKNLEALFAAYELNKQRTTDLEEKVAALEAEIAYLKGE